MFCGLREHWHACMCTESNCARATVFSQRTMYGPHWRILRPERYMQLRHASKICFGRGFAHAWWHGRSKAKATNGNFDDDCNVHGSDSLGRHVLVQRAMSDSDAQFCMRHEYVRVHERLRSRLERKLLSAQSTTVPETRVRISRVVLWQLDRTTDTVCWAGVSEQRYNKRWTTVCLHAQRSEVHD